MEEKNTLKISRLVLVGNGFDLALGLKTSYRDFIFWLKNKFITEAFDNPGKIETRFLQGYLDNDLYSIKIENFNKGWWIEFLETQQGKDISIQNINLNKFISSKNRSNRISAKGSFINQIDSDIDNLGWVNIENIFYQNLKIAKKNNLKILNRQLSVLKDYLIEYLEQEQDKLKSSNNFFSPFRSRIFDEYINNLEFNPDAKIDFKHLKLDRIQFVNFNYTNTVKKLVASFNANQKDKTCPIISIHGSLNESMIFGYGDEEDDEYPVLEKLGDNEYLEHIKSFRYLQDSSYYDLIRFINSGPYQIIILGLSCGLSDRTMLKELFENENCLSIKPYYYKRSQQNGDNDYFDKVMEISRHFTDNGLMRKTVVSFDKCKSMPQAKHI